MLCKNMRTSHVKEKSENSEKKYLVDFSMLQLIYLLWNFTQNTALLHVLMLLICEICAIWVRTIDGYSINKVLDVKLLIPLLTRSMLIV